MADDACAPQLIAPKQTIPNGDAQQTSRKIEATTLSQPAPNAFLLEGNVIFSEPNAVFISDKAEYSQANDKATFEGNIELHQQALTVTAHHASVNNKTQKVRLEHAHYQLHPSRTHGHSDAIDIDQKAEKVTLKAASLTSCQLKPNNTKDWEFTFNRLQVDNQARRVRGQDTVFYFQGVPLLYTPYFDYPLDDRASGLLFPQVGSYKTLSENSRHSYVTLPYYFNIAENIDNTLSMMPIERRGLVADNEFRYIANNHGIEHQAELSLSYLYDQRVAEQGLTQIENDGQLSTSDHPAERWRVKLNANQDWGDGLTSYIDWNNTSDAMFYQDIPIAPNLRNNQYQARTAGLDYQNTNVHAYARIVNYLELLDGVDYYETKPEIGLIYQTSLSDLDLSIQSNWVNFTDQSNAQNRAEGTRLHFAPTLSYTMKNRYGFINTQLQANLTQYQMDDNGFNPSKDSTLQRSVPQLSLHGGMTFERDIRDSDGSATGLTQTLEPELFYLYTPYVNQNDITLFDTGNLGIQFDNLFMMNRFNGIDRIGDSNQVSMAIRSSLFKQNGNKIASAAIGQTVYFTDRKVQLSASDAHTETFSDRYLQLLFESQHWKLDSTTLLDKKDFSIKQASSQFKWHNPFSTVMLNHIHYPQVEEDEHDMLLLGAYSQVADNWHLGIYSSYDFGRDDFYKTELGLRYESCCWATEIIAERTQFENGLYNDGIQFQFELKGISTAHSGFKQKIIDKLNF